MIIPIVISVIICFPLLVWLFRLILSQFKMPVRANLRRVLYNMERTFLDQCRNSQYPVTNRPRLVAVSKTKPVELILEAYQAGQRHFGENYVQELSKKSNHPDVLAKCTRIHWHFIGHLQKRNVKLLTQVPNLWVCETIDCQEIAEILNSKLQEHELAPLRIMVQVNTSREVAKSGCLPESCPDLVKFVAQECPNLEFIGLMTIGRMGHDVKESGDNPDFLSLISCREILCQKFGISIGSMELSMGMSHDYIHAVELGSSNVRVGTGIFGEREPVKKS